ncbi:uncharacterized protein LOC123516406 isoform X3 [Portunus trituberculatus]|uniref:uncharacterized protein LOC123516406 isoform X3 n=1 Tax=Portunus trituberculatus TaxID=210409 RepID=UPI001E1CE5B8|nr:uncharacterized protein LOC123516406 isoform X3 [Portunus trituberculatus]
MSARDKAQGMPRHSSSLSSSTSEGKRREKDPMDSEAKQRKAASTEDCTSQPLLTACASQPSAHPSVAGPSSVNIPAASPPPDVELGCLSSLLSGLIERLDKSVAPQVSPGYSASFSGFHALSSSEDEDGEIVECPSQQSVSDPLDDLDTFTASQTPREPVADVAFQKALEEFAGHFHGEEELGDALSERLASILDVSLRRRPSSDSVKATYEKIKLPNNMLNLKVPVTNSAITKAMSVQGKLVDTRLSLTNGLLAKALVPIARCISDMGERNVQPITCYLDGLNNSLRFLTSAVNYVIQLRKEVARFNVHDSALEELCKWECEVGRDDLFPFDVVKKCEDIHKSRKLGRPAFRPRKAPGKRFLLPRQTPRHPFYQQKSRPWSQTRSFLGQRPPQGKGRPLHKTPH